MYHCMHRLEPATVCYGVEKCTSQQIHHARTESGNNELMFHVRSFFYFDEFLKKFIPPRLLQFNLIKVTKKERQTKVL